VEGEGERGLKGDGTGGRKEAGKEFTMEAVMTLLS